MSAVESGVTAALRIPPRPRSVGELLPALALFFLPPYYLFITAGVLTGGRCILSTPHTTSLEGRGLN